MFYKAEQQKTKTAPIRVRQIVAVQYTDGGGVEGAAISQLGSNEVLTKALNHHQGPNKGSWEREGFLKDFKNVKVHGDGGEVGEGGEEGNCEKGFPDHAGREDHLERFGSRTGSDIISLFVEGGRWWWRGRGGSDSAGLITVTGSTAGASVS